MRRLTASRTEPIYDPPEPATTVVARAGGLSADAARDVLKALAKAGYFVAPRDPINSMLDAYLNAYGRVPTTTSSVIVGIGKARKRWKAMGEVGTRMALAAPPPSSPQEEDG